MGYSGYGWLALALGPLMHLAFAGTGDGANAPLAARVKFTAPADWKEVKKEERDSLITSVYFIPLRKWQGTRHTANAVFVAKKIPAGKGIPFADTIMASQKWPGYTVVSGERDGKNWETFLWRAQDSVPYIGLERIGIKNGVMFEFMLVFPMSKDGSDADRILAIHSGNRPGPDKAGIYVGLRETSDRVKEFDSVCKSMRIDRAEPCRASLRLSNPPKDVPK